MIIHDKIKFHNQEINELNKIVNKYPDLYEITMSDFLSDFIDIDNRILEKNYKIMMANNCDPNTIDIYMLENSNDRYFIIRFYDQQKEYKIYHPHKFIMYKLYWENCRVSACHFFDYEDKIKGFENLIKMYEIHLLKQKYKMHNMSPRLKNIATML